MAVVLTRRGFIKLTGAGLAASSIGALGFGFAGEALEASVRPFKLTATTETRNTCTYCSVACGILIYSLGDRAKNARSDIIHIEGDPDHPVNRGTLCPKGSALLDIVHAPTRLKVPRYRPPGSNEFKQVSWDFALNRVATLMKQYRDANFTAVSLAASFGRDAMTNTWQDIKNANVALVMVARLAAAQHAAATTMGPLAGGPAQDAVEQAVGAGVPPLAAEGHRRDPAWRDGLATLLDTVGAGAIPAPVMARLRDHPMGVEVLADGFLNGGVDEADAGAALFVAAALQVWFTRLAAPLPVASLRLLPQRGLCPCCGSPPVSGVVTGGTPGARYLYCSLCGTAWNHVRASCITCGQSRSVVLKGIEGDAGTVKAETCDDCHTYAKMLY
jgi:formate dehydrogenase accessory protein FdhE